MNRKFDGIWIPANLWFRKDLSITEKILLLEIKSLDNDFGCTKTNKSIGDTFDLKANTVSSLIKSLQDKGFIEVNYRDYNTYEGRVIVINYPNCIEFFTPPEKSKGVTEKSKPLPEKSIHSNTISNNNSNIIEEDGLKNPSPENDNIDIPEQQTENKKGAASKKEPNPLFVACKDFWLVDFHPGWSFGMVQGASLKAIMANLRRLILKTRANCNDDDVLQLFKVLCQGLPDWFKDKDLQVINSKFNEIVTELQKRKNGHSNTKSQSNYQPVR